MLGKNLLWVAKQHGHRITTMLHTYAAWIEGAVETDVEVIDRSMNFTSESQHRNRRPPSNAALSVGSENLAVVLPVANANPGLCAPTFATANATTRQLSCCSAGQKRGQCKIGWGGRIRTYEWRDQNPLPYHLATPQ